ncbi:MAG TPA: hypothetical protein VGD99_26755 [Anaerolineae bacterium]|jgi:hypothetical protein
MTLITDLLSKERALTGKRLGLVDFFVEASILFGCVVYFFYDHLHLLTLDLEPSLDHKRLNRPGVVLGLETQTHP